ncbi:MAG: hypothetical protein ILO36_00795 [Abditibacteriota bacterium]|nr:hypothetical protein [Abditibacteriota bacterium]
MSDLIKKLLSKRAPFDEGRFLAYPGYFSGTVSAVIYAAELYLLVLQKDGGAGMAGPLGLFIALGFIGAALLCFLITNAYPDGGSCYGIVSKSFSHPGWAAFATVSMLWGYIAALAVSVSCSVMLLGCVFPAVNGSGGLWSALLVLLLMFSNLRGGRILRFVLSCGAYLFFALSILLLLTGVVFNNSQPGALYSLSHTYLLYGGAHVAFKSFIFGFASLSGILFVTERSGLSGGGPAPATALSASSLMTLGLFLGFSLLMAHAGILPGSGKAALALLCAGYMGDGFFCSLFIVSAALILLSAANCCFRDFPRLVAVMAEGQLAPRQMRNPGLAQTYSNGIGLLAAAACLGVLILRGNIYFMLPFLAVFQFSAFALMLLSVGVKYFHEKKPLFFALSVAGAVVISALALEFVLIGAGHGTVSALLMATVCAVVSCRIKRHYADLANELRLRDDETLEPRPYKTTALILTSGIHRGVLPAISYAKSISGDTRALFIATDERETRGIKEHWEKYAMGIPLVIMDSPTKNIVGPVLKYVREARRERPGYIINVIIPEIVFRSNFSKLLHNKVALVLRLILSFQKDVIVTHVSYYPAMESKGEKNE